MPDDKNYRLKWNFNYKWRFRTTSRMSLKRHVIVNNWPMQRRLSTIHSSTNKSARAQSPTINLRFILQLVDGCLTLCMLSIFYAICRLPIFFHYHFFFLEKNLSGIPSGCQTLQFRSRLGLTNWSWTVCKYYQQTNKIEGVVFGKVNWKYQLMRL